jgi:hypothetical protein
VIEIAEVFRRFAAGYLSAHGTSMLPSHRRAIEGRSGSASAGFQDAALSDAAGRIRNARSVERMPLARCSPMSSNSDSNRPRVLLAVRRRVR